MKIILTESQLKKLQNNITERYDNNDSYMMKCKVDFDDYGVNFNGNEINYITGYDTINVTYNIEIDARSWGIKDIGLYNISGPSEYEIDVEYYIDEDGNTKKEIILLNLDWENNVEIEEEKSSLITVGNNITLGLKNDESGNIICDKINVTVYTL